MHEFVAQHGVWLAILGMGLVTYLCRISGVKLMSRVRITPRVERGLRALPGSIVLATIGPFVVQAGLVAVLAVAAGIAVMVLRRSEALAILAGLATAALVRAAGL